MERWEYMTQFIYADIDNQGVREYFREAFPDVANPRKFSPQAMILSLNQLGEVGWEIVHMEPVPKVGKNGDIGFSHGGEISSTDWSNVYFCVFKRRLEK